MELLSNVIEVISCVKKEADDVKVMVSTTPELVVEEKPD
jgi:hypothetical protein